MRAASQLCVLVWILTLLVVGCSDRGPVAPESTVREVAPSGDNCDPNLTPC